MTFDDLQDQHATDRLTTDEIIQYMIAASLKRIADNLDLVINHHTYPCTSIAVSSNTDRG